MAITANFNITANTENAARDITLGFLPQVQTDPPVKTPFKLLEPKLRSSGNSDRGRDPSPRKVNDGKTSDVCANPDPGISKRRRDTELVPGSSRWMQGGGTSVDSGIMGKGCFGGSIAPKNAGSVSDLNGSSRVTEKPRLQAVSVSQLQKINPYFESNRQLEGLSKTSDLMFGVNSSFVRPIPGMTGFTTLKPISMGGGLTLPPGTKISNLQGIVPIGGPLYQPAEASGIRFELPSGKVIDMGHSRRMGAAGTTITFPDGKKHEMSGMPFFNPITVNLGQVAQIRTDTNTSENRTYRLRPTIFGDKY